MSKILPVAIALTVIGSALELPQTANSDIIPPAAFEPGLVVFATDHDLGLESLSLAKIDPVTCHVTDTATIAYDPSQSGDTMIHQNFEPGIWIVAESTFKHGKETTVIKYDNGSYAFPVEEGEVTYVGKLVLTTGTSTISMPDRTQLDRYIDGQYDITAEPIVVVPWITPFSTDDLSPVAGCNPSLFDEAI